MAKKNNSHIRGLRTQIRHLKQEIRLREDKITRLREEIATIPQRVRGDLIALWTPHQYCQTINGTRLGSFVAGDQVALIGKVAETKTWIDEKGCLRSQANFQIRQTRKVSGFLTD